MTATHGIGRLAAIGVYPVKSLHVVPVSSAEIEPWGLVGDRRWLVVDEQWRFLTQRSAARMAVIEARMVAGGGLVLSGAGLPALAVTVPDREAAVEEVTVWRDKVPARVADAAAGRWLTEALGVRCGLVHLHDTAARPTDPAFAPAGSTVSFADGFPVLLTSMASLADLNGRLAQPVGMERFRANLIVEGFEAWAEDEWGSVVIGDVEFLAVKPCVRCVVTTIDQATGSRPDGVEPLRTLAEWRGGRGAGVTFGQNLVPVRRGRIAVGDEVKARGSAPGPR